MATDQLLDLIDGMTQDERRITALDPGYIKIDDRKIHDLLRFMADFSSQINFYNEKNVIDGDWKDFFRSDINILVLLITKYDLTSHLAQFERLEANVLLSHDDETTITAFDQLLKYMQALVISVGDTRKSLLKGTHYNKNAYELAEVLAEFDSDSAIIVSIQKEAEKLYGISASENIESVDTNTQDLYFHSNLDARPAILEVMPQIRSTFNSMRSKYNNFLALTSFHFKDHDISRFEYEPHLALCITFLHLFQYLQDQINHLPQVHLDFYYRQILGMRSRPAIPDTVDLVIEPVLKESVLIKKGEQLIAESNGQKQYYALNEDIRVTRARVAAIKTIFLDEHTQVVSPDPAFPDVKETEVYQAKQRVPNPESILRNQSSVKSWPIFGESQFELADEDRTMEDTDLGILLASPVLYQTEGSRSISIILFFDQSSFIQLLQYFRNFAKITGKQLQTISFEMLSDAFVVSFTASEGWEEVKRYTVSINMAERNIEIAFEQSPVDKAIVLYDPQVHGEEYNLEWPVIRLLLNNYSIHNSFSFFRKMILERVTISAKVNGNRSVKLQNNIGALSAENPFHPFGPQPSVGSFLEIKNTNIFNRFTRDFCIKLEWIDLPRDPGGWDTYYKEYNLNISNDSFKVKLSGLSQGKYKPVIAKRQEFNLFELEAADFGPPLLSDVTEIKDVDLKKLELPNKPLMDKEALVDDNNFTEGAVRLEFTSPQEAFGSRVYPQIFPDAVLHNSKRFVKKRPLPNPPNIPVVKSISISYTLEHSEVLVKSARNDDSALKIIHQYPFGYEHIYPESDKQPYRFIPDFEYENNLYIGIENLEPEQDLSLLFQLKETNFTNTANEQLPIVWSYMYDNSWIDFPDSMVLFDSTNRFINSGIVKLRMPEDVKPGNTRLDPKLYWIRASCGRQLNKMSQMIGVYLHAVTASQISVGDEELAQISIAPNSITAFRTKIPGINSVFQLFHSYGGREAETTAQFHVRVSERLRHRNRLVTNRDIESAILERFPELLMVKSISPDSSSGLASRKIRVIIVPKENRNDLSQFEQPKVNLALLYKIKTFVRQAISPFAEVEIENPVYEKIKLLGKIKFLRNENSDVGLLMQTLNEDLKRYLCPWLFEAGSTFKIGSQIYLADLLNFIKRRPYIEYITGFSVIHFYNWQNELTGEVLSGMNDLGINEQEYIKGSVPEAVIVPSEEHMLTVMNESWYAEPDPVGIGNLLIAEELLVYDENLNMPAKDFSPYSDNKEEMEYLNLTLRHNIS